MISLYPAFLMKLLLSGNVKLHLCLYLLTILLSALNRIISVHWAGCIQRLGRYQVLRIKDQVMAERSALNETFLPSPPRLRDVSGEGVE